MRDPSDPDPTAPADGDPQDRVESMAPAEIRHQPSVQAELKKAAPDAAPEKLDSPLRHVLIAALLFATLTALFVLSRRGVLWPDLTDWDVPRRALRAAVVVSGILTVYFGTMRFVLPRISDRAVRFNLRRALKLAATLVAAFSAVSILFVGWYGAAVSVGLISLIFGWALQAPLTSFFAWIFLLLRRPYRVGDRIRIGSATGDVIDVGYLDTTLWEFGGEFLSTDHPSGRIIRFPNSMVFNTMVYNYSWPLFPYIWNEITVQLAYETDLEFVTDVLRTTVEEELGSRMSERVAVYRDLLAETPVDQLEVEDRPSVLFRVNPNTWIDATVRYLVTPRRAGRRKTLLTRRILDRLNAAPQKVMFPKENMR
ncbi:MAG TPA: mechanosensitive ion channel family protein [Thermoanaerobaculia bacterium]|jgi:small-conductance mechanosensitive channel